MTNNHIIPLAANTAWRKPSAFAWVMAVIAFCILIALGTWQMQRLAWKEGLIAKMQHSATSEPEVGLPATTTLGGRGFDYFRVRGVFLHDKEFHLGARTHKEKQGYHILTPFMLEDGRQILLNRGWVPADKKEASTRLDSLTQLEDDASIVIRIRTDDDRNYFTPEHSVKDNIWFWKNIPAMNAESGLKLIPYSADVMNPREEGVLPVPLAREIELRNDHLMYAVTWYLLAVCELLVGYAYYRKSRAA